MEVSVALGQLLAGQLGDAVEVCRLRMIILVIGLVRVAAQAVGGAGADVHEPLDADLARQFEQVSGSGEVDVENFLAAGGFPVRAVDSENGGVNDLVNGMRSAKSVKAGGVQDVTVDKGDPFGQVAQEVRHERVGGQNVIAHHFVPAGRKLLHYARPDEADATGYQSCHGSFLPEWQRSGI